jgi:uncharacterized lipoprotein YddW (UPF0748 family)
MQERRAATSIADLSLRLLPGLVIVGESRADMLAPAVDEAHRRSLKVPEAGSTREPST